MVKHKIMHYRKKRMESRILLLPNSVCSKFYFNVTVEVDAPEERSLKSYAPRSDEESSKIKKADCSSSNADAVWRTKILNNLKHSVLNPK